MSDVSTPRPAAVAEYEYIVMRPDNTVPKGQKTSRWDVWNKRHDEILGVIHWSGPWRQYIYAPMGPAVYSAGCLRDIADFLERANKAHRTGEAS